MPFRPSSVTASIGPPLTVGTVSVSWTASSAPNARYNVDRSNSGGSYFRVATNTTSRQLTQTIVAGGNSRWRVQAINTFGTTSGFTTSNLVTRAPNAPGSVSLSRLTDLASIRVSWGSSGGATGYDVERSQDGGGFVRVSTGTTLTANNYVGLTRGSSYRFRVRANNAGGSSGFTTSGSLTLVPFRPGSVSASLSGDTSIRVTFPASNGATGYDIDRRENNGGWSRVTSNTGSRDLNYGGLNRGSTYQFRVFARNSGGQSPTARESNSVQVPFPPPGAPSSASISKNKRDVSISLGTASAPSGTSISSYEIEIRVEGGSYGSRRSVSTSSRSTTYTNLTPGATYRGRGRAIGTGGAGDWRETGTVTISSPPAAPSNILRTRSFRSVLVELGASTAASDVTISGYTIQRRESFNNGATWGNWGDQRSVTTTDRTTTYTNLTPETTQQFRGRAESDFNSSDWRTSETLFIPGIPDPPSQVFAFREGAAVFVVVAAPVSDGGAPVLTYTIEKRISDDFEQTWSEWEDPVTIAFSQPTYLYENLELQKTYQFRALATNSEGDSEGFTESNAIYLPAIMKIYDGNEFRLPGNYRRYSEEVGDWVGLRISRRYFNGQWVELE